MFQLLRLFTIRGKCASVGSLRGICWPPCLSSSPLILLLIPHSMCIYSMFTLYMKQKRQSIIMQILLGLVVAELVTGFIHWFEDNYLSFCIDFPFIGQIAKNNEIHHYYPRAMLINDGWVEEVIFYTIFALCFYLVLFLVKKSLFFDYPYTFIVLFIFLIITNFVFHVAQHQRDCERPKLLTFLYRANIIQSDKRHRTHHLNPGTNYFILFPLSNIIFDNLYLWRILEFFIWIFTGIKPDQKQGYAEYKTIHTSVHQLLDNDCPRVISKDEYNKLVNILSNTYSKCCAERQKTSACLSERTKDSE